MDLFELKETRRFAKKLVGGNAWKKERKRKFDGRLTRKQKEERRKVVVARKIEFACRYMVEDGWMD